MDGGEKNFIKSIGVVTSRNNYMFISIFWQNPTKMTVKEKAQIHKDKENKRWEDGR